MEYDFKTDEFIERILTSSDNLAHDPSVSNGNNIT